MLRGDDDARKFVSLKENRRAIMKECLDDPTAGHVGLEKTLDRVARYFTGQGFMKPCKNTYAATESNSNVRTSSVIPLLC